MASQIQLRRGTTIQWDAANPVLADGEIGIDSTTRQIKIGDGYTAWSNLQYGLATTVADGSVTEAKLNPNALSSYEVATIMGAY
jgi:hypothetical protein